MQSKTYSLMPSLDCETLTEAERIVAATCSHPMICGYKVGFSLGLSLGLPRIVEMIKRYSSKTIVYDHQKAGTDIPETGPLFARTLQSAGIDQAILFPQAGQKTLQAWVEALVKANIKPVVGGIMTHNGYLASEGGYLNNDAPISIYRDAKALGVNSFVVPLTRPKQVQEILQMAGIDPKQADFMSPGFGAQGGNPHEFSFIQNHTLIVGRALIKTNDLSGTLADLVNSL